MDYLLTPENEVKLEFEPENGRDYKLGELCKIVCCDFIQIIFMNEKLMVIDEVGKIENKKINMVATDLLHLAGGAKSDYIVGNAFICPKDAIK